MKVSAMKVVGAGRLTMTPAYRPQPDGSDVYGLAKRAAEPRADRAMPRAKSMRRQVCWREPLTSGGRLLPNDRWTITQASRSRNEKPWDSPQDCLYPGDCPREEHGRT